MPTASVPVCASGAGQNSACEKYDQQDREKVSTSGSAPPRYNARKRAFPSIRRTVGAMK